MAKYRIGADVEFETITPGELRGELTAWDARRDQAAQQELRALKIRRLPPMTGVVAAGAVTIGGDSGQAQVGPASGYTWFIRLISVTGLAFGGTPDVLNMQILGAGSGNWWQFNGNSFATGWGLGEMWLEGGEYLGFTNQGAITAPTGTTIKVQGMIWQVPSEMAGQLMGRGRG